MVAGTITGEHNNHDQIWLYKQRGIRGFCIHRRFRLLYPSVIGTRAAGYFELSSTRVHALVELSPTVFWAKASNGYTFWQRHGGCGRFGQLERSPYFFGAVKIWNSQFARNHTSCVFSTKTSMMSEKGMMTQAKAR